MKRALAIALASMLPSVASAKTVAVVVGNNEPPAGVSGQGLSTLRYADDDAHRYAQLMERFADETVLLTVYDAQTRARVRDAPVDGPPTLAALKKALTWAGDDDGLTVYIVFTGHGALDETGAPFLALLDAPLTRDLLFDEILAQLPADRVHLIIDACHAAGVLGIRGGRFGTQIEGTTSELTVQDEERWAKEHTLARFPHVGVLASSSAGESSHEWSVLEAGVFSHEVLSGMWGAADINADRRIEYSELQSFVASANRGVADPRAKPSVVVHPPALDPHEALVDLDALRNTALLEGDLSALGHFHVELSDGRRHLDGHVGGPVALALPPGTAYLRSGDTEFAVRVQRGDRVAFASLTGRPSGATARGSTEASFRQQLFSEPYTYDYYRGFVDSVGGTPVSAPTLAEALREKPPPPPPRPSPATPIDEVVATPTATPHAQRGGAALVALAAVSGLTAIGTGIGAGVLRSRFSRADGEREAAPLTEPHRQLATAAVTSAIVGGVMGLAGALLLRRASNNR